MSRKKILLADDADLIVKLERALFRRKAFHLLVARSASQVLEVLERETPDLIFIDLALPGMAGDECCRRIKEDPRLSAVPVVILARDEEEEVLRCRTAGCDEILIRPIDRNRLAETVRRLLEIPSRRISRYDTSLHIAYGIDPGHLFTGEALNLSTAGVLLETRHLFAVDTMVLIEIRLPGESSSIRCRGRVAWLSRSARTALNTAGEMGVQFYDISEQSKDILQTYLETEGLRPDR